MHQIVTRVIGVSNKNTDGHSRQKILEKYAKKGGAVVLKHVLSQDGDPNTVEVLIDCEEGKKQGRIGFLPGRIGEKLVRYLDNDREVTAVISSLPVGEESQQTGVHLKITF